MDLTLKQEKHTNETGRLGIHPKMFALLLGIASIVMMFAGLTSAYLVKRADTASWVDFKLPVEFLYSSGIIVLSSVLLHAAWVFYKKNNRSAYSIFLGLTLLFGIGFLVSQLMGWFALRNIGIDWVGSPSGGFVYAISWFHAAHIVGGLVILLISFIRSINKIYDPICELRPVINPSGKLNVQMMCIYWHFVDVLWIYLFVFLYMNHQ